MTKFYQVSKKSKEASGFWQSDDKIYIDHIKIINIQKYSEFSARRSINFKNNELTVFYIQNNKAYIDSVDGTSVVLEKQTVKYYKYLTSTLIKNWIRQFGGCTVKREISGYYSIEAWSN